MTKIDLKKAHLCSVCNKYACYYDGKKWWCSIQSDMGTFNMKGYCKDEKRKGSKGDKD